MNKNSRIITPPDDPITQKDRNAIVLSDCIFCKIIAGLAPATYIKETKNLIVIQDRYPQAPVHFLIIPKKHISDISAFTQQDSVIAGELLLMAQELSAMRPDTKQFKLESNNGSLWGQTVFHTHIHFLSGKIS